MEQGPTYDALDVSNGGLQHLQDITGNIRYLDASKNQLTSLQEASLQLQHLSNLQQLILARNRLLDVSGLQLMPDLRVLNLSRNKITDLTPLEALTRLQELDLHSNCISSLAPLSTLTSLVSLNAAANQLQDLPCLAGLTNLTELNLRHNFISALTAPPVAAAAGAVAGTPCSSGLLPASLQRLSLACNHLQDVSTLTVLRQLPNLLDLCVDDNPFTAASRNKHLAATAAAAAIASVAAGGSSNSSDSWYREAVLLAACTPTLLRLDGHTVSPTERAMLLTTAANLHAVQTSQYNKGLDTVLSTQPLGRPQSAMQPKAAVTAAASSGTADSGSLSDASSSSEGRAVAATAERERAMDAAVAAAPPAEQQAQQLLPAPGDTPRSVVNCQWHEQDTFLLTDSALQQQQQQQQQQQRRLSTTLQHQGSLKSAALVCGVDMPVDGTVRVIPTAAAGSTGKKSQVNAARLSLLPAFRPASAQATETAAVEAAAAAAAGSEPAHLGSPEVFGVFVSDAEVEEYMQVEKARFSERPRSGPLLPPPPANTPGMELVGSRCVLTGSVLHLLKGEALAGVADLTLQHVAWAEVLDAILSLLALRRLRSLTLGHIKGLSTLPQLHPLLQLRKLCHLSLQDCPISKLVLLRPYVTFRFASLQSFNGTPFTAEEVSAAGQLFGVLEATLDAALDQPSQQAALKAAGIHISSSSQTRPVTAEPVEPNSETAALLQRLSLAGATPGFAAGRRGSMAAGNSNSSSGCNSSSRVTQVLAAMQGPLMPPTAAMETGKVFVQQFLSEAAVVQQQLAEFDEVTWPALIETCIHEAWSGHPAGFKA